MNDKTPPATARGDLTFLSEGGEMGEMMRRFDWEGTSFGPPRSWPECLKTAVSICLNSRFPIPIWWGPELRLIYNDAWRPVLGRTKHPFALGARGQDVWPEIWHIIGPMLRGVLEEGRATWSDDGLLMLDRNGYLEEAYFTYSYSPIRNERGEVEGVFSAVNETTARVIGERQIALLRELGAHTAEVRTFQQACDNAAAALRSDPQDLPFALLFLRDAATGRWQLTGHCGFDGGVPAGLADAAAWGLDDTVAQDLRHFILPARPDGWPRGCWEHEPTHAVTASLAPTGAQGKSGVLVAGLSPHRLFDDAYRRFIELIAGQVAAAIGNAQAYEEERRRAQALAELDRAKTTFFSNVSHEFRTPLTLMLGPLADLLAGASLPPALREPLSLVERNGLRLAKLVNALLEFSRLEAGRVEARYEETDLAQLTRDLASAFRSAMERAGLDFEVDCELMPPAWIDREMWERIVFNLLSNALKFTLSGRVTVRLRRGGDCAELEVQDTGAGIPEGELPRLFERFHRVEGTAGRTHEGSGIGLALVQELVKLHAGTIEAASTLGQGTTFTVRVPLRSARAAAYVAGGHQPAGAASTRAAGVHGREYVEEALRWSPGNTAPAVQPPPDAAAGDLVGMRYRGTLGARIVLADDNADMRDYVAALLSPYYRVEVVADGAEALAAARRERPALILSDVMMPRVDGFALLAAVRADARLRTVPMVLLSARAGEEARVEGLDRGADDYIVKPFTARELLARVAALLEIDRTRRRSEEQLRLGLASAEMFTWSADAGSGRVSLSDNAFEVLGASPADLESGFALVHPDDEPRYRAMVERVLEHGGYLHDELRVIRPRDGKVRWIEVRGRTVDAEGSGRELSGLAFDVTARKELELMLRDVDARKDEFLAMLAHELRNPLAPIRTGAELVMRLTQDGRVIRVVEMIKRQAGQLSRMVDDLLDVSRISRGRIELRRSRVRLAEVLRAALEAVEPQRSAKNHVVEVHIETGQAEVEGDAARLQQSFVNILANAFKYTPPGGRILVRLREEQAGAGLASAVVTVADNGAGIEPELLPTIFDLFVQSRQTLDRSEGGLGIGLSIVRKLVQMHGGQVVASSAGPGRGATFEVRLPLAGGVEAGIPAGGDLLAPPVATSQPRRLLVVDDNRDAASTLCLMLEMEGYEVAVANEARAAIARAASWRPDAVILDIGLPEIDGYEVARQIRSQLPPPGPRLIALTGYGQPADRQLAAAAGFDVHLVKPASLEALNDALRQPPRQE